MSDDESNIVYIKPQNWDDFKIRDFKIEPIIDATKDSGSALKHIKMWVDAVANNFPPLPVKQCYNNRARKYYRKFLSAVKQKNSKNIIKYMQLHMKYASMANVESNIYPVDYEEKCQTTMNPSNSSLMPAQVTIRYG